MDLRTFEAGRAWVDATADALIQALQRRPELRLCLPTGSTPAPVYEAVVRATQAGDVSWRDATVFLLDEFGGLPPGDRGRCAVTLRRQLIDGIDLPPASIRELDVDAADLDAMSARFDQSLAPGLDLVVLGLGVNGHVGMNEPGSAADSPTRKVDLAPETIAGSARYLDPVNRHPDRLPTWGVTLGMAAIRGAREVWVWVTGTGKAEIVRACVEGPSGEDRPASLLAAHPACTWWLDEPAAALLDRR